MPSLRGRLRERVPLAPYTSWQIGGAAHYLYEPADSEDLAYFLQQWPEHKPLLWLGLGSNILIRDGGFPGAVIITHRHLNTMALIGVGQIRAEVGVACPRFARFCVRHHLAAAEFLTGIPGTLGGALAMNAGCHGQEIWSIVTAVETLNCRGEKRIRSPKDYLIGYRSISTYPNEWFTAGYFQLPPGSQEDSLSKIQALLDYRLATQPIHKPSCGSVFRNPPGDYAARIIEACGLKGHRMGSAYVSPQHANFITHDGTASAATIEALIQEITETVFRQYAIQLVCEVHIVGSS